MATPHFESRRIFLKEAAVPEKEQRLLCASTVFDKKVNHNSSLARITSSRMGDVTLAYLKSANKKSKLREIEGK